MGLVGRVLACVLRVLWRVWKGAVHWATGRAQLTRLVDRAPARLDAAALVGIEDSCLAPSRQLAAVMRRVRSGTADATDESGAAMVIKRISAHQLDAHPLVVDATSPDALMPPRGRVRANLHRLFGVLCAYYAVLLDVRSRCATPFEADRDEARLAELWRLGTHREMTARRTKAWDDEFGFQGEDPVTDFRGLGCYALDILIHLIRTNETLWRDMVQKYSGVQHAFPPAIGVINIASQVLARADSRPLRLAMYRHGPAMGVSHLNDAIVAVMEHFSSYYYGAAQVKSVMEFNAVTKKFFDSDLWARSWSGPRGDKRGT